MLRVSTNIVVMVSDTGLMNFYTNMHRNLINNFTFFSWRIISLRALVNICVVILLAVSAYAVVTVVSRSDDNLKVRSWWRENETTIVVTVISITFPVFFELLGFLEHYHPRKQLRLQLAR